ncbi:hypothetical protein EDEG_00189 [Edhazardia aedis USNM 41457]|uniref:Uncharacterized protein n=1 Tax=Edhazardia aedis (strain USNM 41457) TaxID=1003232 RepID=J9D7E3_EDHAE|nr:hypothetical protein EDEG_00189 [Edhazardia aedis USNM 41457]|eukprot:EJW03701.1 hypothetical protein EDEG_00189 [Edhazardia aedis USNM 41457]
MQVEEDEIEFFECVPSSFIDTFKEEMIEVLSKSIEKEDNQKLSKNELVSELQKNFVIFQNFILRNIFSLPGDGEFSLERKITDNYINENFENQINESFVKTVEEINHLKKNLIKIENDIIVSKYHIDQLNKLLVENNILREVLEEKSKLSAVHLELKEKSDSLDKININPNVSGLDILLEDPAYQEMVILKQLKTESEEMNINLIATHKKHI